MKLKQILSTAFITLIVTILSGIIVNWYVKSQLEEKKKYEDIVYEIKRNSNFESDSLKITLFTVDILNIGNVNAKNVEIVIEFEKNTNIIDATGILERTNVDFKLTKLQDNKISYITNCLYSNDKLTINVVLNNLILKPSILVQSSESVGKPYIKKEEEANAGFLDKGIEIIILTILLLFPILYFFTRISKKFSGYHASLNNSAFLFLHNNQFGYAIELLISEIKLKGGSSNKLSNLALAKCLNKENKEDIDSLLRMSEFVASTKRDMLILSFNMFLISCYFKDYLKARESFDIAVKIENKEFNKYLDYSLVVADFIKNDKNVSDIIETYKSNLHNKGSFIIGG